MSVSDHYDASAAKYHEQYEREGIFDLSREYPANYFRLQKLVSSFLAKKVKRVIEVGVGEGTPLATLANAGIEVSGFDISDAMVLRSKESIRRTGQDPDRIIWGDIEKPDSYKSLLLGGKFDALMAMGVMPHVADDGECLMNMKAMIKPGGHVFIEFRNKLFSLFTFNRNTYEFIMDELLSDVSPAMRTIAGDFLRDRVVMGKPDIRSRHDDDETKPGYDAILSKFHNPLTIIDDFKDLGFTDAKLLWYHYHPAMPLLSELNESEFRAESVKLESDTSNWRGMFLCSAFVVEARVDD